MPFQALRRHSLPLLLVTLLAGCSAGGAGEANPYADTGREDDCVAEPSKCRYEAGEREYAEDEAARLNRKSTRKLRGGGWFW